MPKITPFLWFDNQAAEAARFYVSVFPNSEFHGANVVGEGAPTPTGEVMVATFRLDQQEFIGLNGGPHFKFTEAVSFMIDCATQTEVDYYWDALSAGGETSQCGWLKDKYGLSWQVVPKILGELMGDKDRVKADRVMQAMLKMTKLDVAGLQAAHDND